MILIKYTNRFDFEYDIQGLVRSFYPGVEMRTIKKNEEAEDNTNLIITIIAEFQEYPEYNNEHDFYANMKLSLFDSENNLISYRDFRAAVELLSYDKVRIETKNRLKRALYELLSDYTEIELPWGTLSGIRPTKISSKMLESGMNEDEVISALKDIYYLSDEKACESVNISKYEIEILNSIDYKNGYSLYIGIPFCPSTCLYCSFTSNPLSKFRDIIDRYLDALIMELKSSVKLMSNRQPDTVYIGGGTPTTLESVQLDRLLTAVEDVIDCNSLKEFTVEAGRPDSITASKLEVIKNHKVTRISINPQTMHDKTLKLIGRHHTVADFENAYKMARNYGFDNINMDFILGLPGEDAEDVRYSMEQVMKLKPDSLTIHSLAVKRAARLNIFKDAYKNYTIENTIDIMNMTKDTASALGLKPYYLYRQKNMAGNLENTGYASEGKAGIYNILIMEEKQPIIAVGAGSSTKMVFKDGKTIVRIENVKDVEQYINRIDEMIERKTKFIRENPDF